MSSSSSSSSSSAQSSPEPARKEKKGKSKSAPKQKSKSSSASSSSSDDKQVEEPVVEEPVVEKVVKAERPEKKGGKKKAAPAKTLRPKAKGNADEAPAAVPQTQESLADQEYEKGLGMMGESASLIKKAKKGKLAAAFDFIAAPVKKEKKIEITCTDPHQVLGALYVARFADHGQSTDFHSGFRENPRYAKIIAALLQHEYSGVRRMAARFVGDSILKCSPEDNLANALYFANTEVITNIVSLVKHSAEGLSDDPQVRESFLIALGTVRILAKHEDQARAQNVSFNKFFLDAGVIPAISSLIGTKRDTDFVTLSTGCVRAICVHNPAAQSEFIKAGAVKVLIGTLFDGDDARPSSDLLSALAALVGHEEAKKEFLAANGFAGLDALRRRPAAASSVSIMTQVCEVIRSLCNYKTGAIQTQVKDSGLLQMLFDLILGGEKKGGDGKKEKKGKKSKDKAEKAPQLSPVEALMRCGLMRAALLALSEAVATNLGSTKLAFKAGIFDKCKALLEGKDEASFGDDLKDGENDDVKKELKNTAHTVRTVSAFCLSALLSNNTDHADDELCGILVKGLRTPFTEVNGLRDHCARCFTEIFSDEEKRRARAPAIVDTLLELADVDPAKPDGTCVEPAFATLAVILKDREIKVDRNRVLTVVNKALQRNIDPRSMMQLCKCVNACAADDAKWRANFAKASAARLCDLLAVMSPKVQQNIAYTIWIVIKDSKDAVKNQFIDNKCIDHLLAMFKSEESSDSVLEYAAGALSALVQKSRKGRAAVAAVEDSMSAIVAMTGESHSPKIRTVAAKLVWYACLESDAVNQKAAIAAGVILALTAVIEFNDPGMAMSGAGALSAVLLKNADAAKPLSKSISSVAAALGQALERFGEASFKEDPKAKVFTKEAGAFTELAKLAASLAKVHKDELVANYVVEGLEHCRNAKNSKVSSPAVTALKALGCKKAGDVTGPPKKKSSDSKSKSKSAKADKEAEKPSKKKKASKSSSEEPAASSSEEPAASSSEEPPAASSSESSDSSSSEDSS